MDKIARLLKVLYLRYKQPTLNLKVLFTQQRLFLLVFIIKMLQPAEKINIVSKIVRKITITYSGFQNSDENPNNSSPV